MKHRLFTLAVIFLFFMMLLFPGPVFKGASQGILLWFRTVLPTLLPFMIMANLMIHTNAVYFISKAAGSLIGRLLNVSDCGAFAVITGFLCGYPMGAKVTADLLKEKRICHEEAEYLLSFCNNTSPMFMISYVGIQNIKEPSLLIPSVVILFSSPLLCSRIFYRFFSRKAGSIGLKDGRFISFFPQKKASFSYGILDTCMMDGFDSITRVGGYIMLFSVFMNLAFLLPAARYSPAVCILSFMEITAGIPMLSALPLPLSVRWTLMMALTSFGGLCAAAQTYSMIRESHLKISLYLIEKLVTALATSLLCILYIYVCF